MRKMAGFVVGVLTVILSSGTSLACNVAWNFEELAPQADALVRGRVIRVEEGGRVAVLAVSDYLGPGTVPRELRVGPTVSSAGPKELLFGGQRTVAAAACPDQSVVFHRGQEYAALLDVDGPVFRLAYPQGKTAVPVDGQGMIPVGPESAQKRSAQAFMMEFAVRHRLVDWGRGLVPVGLALLGVAGLGGAWLVAWRRRR